jgi:hypothetical protein
MISSAFHRAPSGRYVQARAIFRPSGTQKNMGGLFCYRHPAPLGLKQSYFLKLTALPLPGAGLLSSLKYWLHTVRPELVEGSLCRWFDRLTTNGNRELNSPASQEGNSRRTQEPLRGVLLTPDSLCLCVTRRQVSEGDNVSDG